MKTVIFAAGAAILLVSAPVAALARPYTPHPTNAGIAHKHNGASAYKHSRRISKGERVYRRENTHNFGNPNARNPSRAGYQQQLGSTTNGPRY
nr:hypothetical protein [Methylobacterium sp. FF17]